MARKPKIRLKRKNKNCETVLIRGGYADNPIGEVCRRNGGYMVRFPPVPTTQHGPIKTKSQAVLRVVHRWQTWIGLPPGTLRY